ncbi:MAG TPA: ABC transporter ATP-binding protein [Acidimicrobiales bacterium]|nr:ABC transporter ATP-binding protein [Acidimicrobiales bacterium]
MTGLQVSGLTVVRGSATGPPAIGPISLSLEPGKALGIVGETGSGKTMTLRALMGLLPANFHFRGEVRLGREVGTTEDQLGRWLGRSVGVVLQNPFTAFDPLKSVGAQIVEGALRRRLLPRAEAHARAIELLEEMGFAHPEQILRLFPNQLSGGMAQRIAIAMALMPHPALLLADEPTSALDATLRLGVLRLIRRVTAATGAVLLIISHDLRLVSRFCDQIMVMYAGRAVESGPADELLNHPEHPYTRALIACTPALGSQGKRRLASIPGSPASLFQTEPCCRFAPRCSLAEEPCRHSEPQLLALGGAMVACPVVSRKLAESR